MALKRERASLPPIYFIKALMLPEKKLRARIQRLLDDASQAKGHIFNLGHGIHQFTPPEQARILVDAVHELSRR